MVQSHSTVSESRHVTVTVVTHSNRFGRAIRSHRIFALFSISHACSTFRCCRLLPQLPYPRTFSFFSRFLAAAVFPGFKKMAMATALLQSLGLSAVCWDPSSLSWRGGTRRIRRRAIDGGRWRRREPEPEPPSPRPFLLSLRCQCQEVERLETNPRQDSGGSKSTIGSCE